MFSMCGPATLRVQKRLLGTEPRFFRKVASTFKLLSYPSSPQSFQSVLGLRDCISSVISFLPYSAKNNQENILFLRGVLVLRIYFLTFFFKLRDSINAVPPNHNLCSRISWILRNFSDQHKYNEWTLPKKPTFLIIPPCQQSTQFVLLRQQFDDERPLTRTVWSRRFCFVL